MRGKRPAFCRIKDMVKHKCRLQHVDPPFSTAADKLTVCGAHGQLIGANQPRGFLRRLNMHDKSYGLPPDEGYNGNPTFY